MANPLTIVGASLALVDKIAEWVHEGLSDKEIRKRLADPKGVGQDLISATRRRKKKLDDFKKDG